MKKIIVLIAFFGGTCLFAQQTGQSNLFDKVKKVQNEEESVLKKGTANKEFQMQQQSHLSKIVLSRDIEEEEKLANKEFEKEIKQDVKENQTEVPPQKENIEQKPETNKNSISAQKTEQPLVSDQEQKQETKPTQNIKQENIVAKEDKTKKTKTNPDPEGVDWISLSKGKLNVKMQRRTHGVSTPNLSLKFNNVYQSLFRNIPWLMGGSANVYVYQNRKDFLAHEAVASDWSGAFFSPDNNRIVLYDEPDNVNKMLRQFEHELTHLFMENYYCPLGSTKPEPPVWLNEGLAVNMEDITNNVSGGVWAQDLVVMTILPSPKSPAASLKVPRPVSNATTQFILLSDFVKNDSYDSAVAAGKVEDWYMQAYAMVRFLFKPYNNQYPEKRMQFEQFTKLLNTYQNKKDSKGRLVKDEQGHQVKTRVPVFAALQKAYGFNSMDDFEMKFWQWLYEYQRNQREKLK